MIQLTSRQASSIYKELVEEQANCCAICGLEQGKLSRHMPVDHDHQTGAIRGLLCHHCNVMLGMARDNASILRAAAAYLDTHPGIRRAKHRARNERLPSDAAMEKAHEINSWLNE